MSRLGTSGTISWMVTHFTYDAALRQVTEIAPDGSVDSTVYDRAGNVKEAHTRRADPATPAKRLVISMDYDTLNRLTARRSPQVHYLERREGIPTQSAASSHDGATVSYPQYPNDASTGYLVGGDTALFTYDAMSQIIAADNHDAHVTRSYYPNGLLRDETLQIRTLAELLSGGDFATHSYGTEAFYDLDGRRTKLKHPDALAPTVSEVAKDTTSYGYSPTTGELTSVTDQLGNQFTFAYDNRGSLQTVTRPGGISETLTYDDGGRLAHNLVSNASPSTYGYPETTIRSADFGYDIRDKLLLTASTVGTRDTLVATYSPLGYVSGGHTISHDRTLTGRDARSYSGETPTYDGLGNQLTLFSEQRLSINGDQTNYSASNSTYGYESGVGRLVTFQQDTIKYDGAGNEIFRTAQPSSSSPRSLRDVASYYSADGKLRAVDSRSLASDDPMAASFFTRVFEEYRYDALGRRVLARSRRSCDADPENFEAECRQSTIRRFAWDGDEEFYEIQMPGGDGSAYLENDTTQVVLAADASGGSNSIDPNPFYGRVAYAYGLGIDQPVSIIRMGYGDRFNQHNADVGHRTLPPFLLSPLWNERGQAYLGTFDDGGIRKCATSGNDTVCVTVGWAEQRFAYIRPQFRPAFWHGGAIGDNAEHSGLLYRRDRYYDSEKGRFTQEDPVGLAGGVNLYGFASGDPINLSDPFGLRPLTAGERLRMGNYCDQVDCDKVNVYDGSGSDAENAERRKWLGRSGGVSITIGNNVYLSDDAIHDFGTLSHELGHVYQFQVDYKSSMPRYLAIGIANQTSNWVFKKTQGVIGRNEYNVGTLLSNKPFSKYRMEQQAEIVRLCVTGVVPWACSTSPIHP